DQRTMMPAKGARVRAEQLATIGQVAHEKFVASEIGRLLDDLQAYGEGLPYDSDEASLIRVTRRDWDKARRVPAELRAEMARTASLASEAWVEARQRSQCQVFDDLKQDLVPLIAAVAERGRPVDDSVLRGDFPADKQRTFVTGIISRFGFQEDSWRLDPTVHP